MFIYVFVGAQPAHAKAAGFALDLFPLFGTIHPEPETVFSFTGRPPEGGAKSLRHTDPETGDQPHANFR